MPLTILLPIVVLGIAGIVIATWAMGFAKQFVIDGSGTAKARWLREWPEDRINGVLVAEDGHAALIETGGGPGLLWVMGADTTAKRLSHADVADGTDGVTIYLHDFTAPKVRVRLNAGEHAAWTAKLKEAIHG